MGGDYEWMSGGYESIRNGRQSRGLWRWPHATACHRFPRRLAGASLRVVNENQDVDIETHLLVRPANVVDDLLAFAVGYAEITAGGPGGRR